MLNKKLSEFEKGEKGIIMSVDESDVRLKLMELGCVPGTEVILAHIAPLGDPIAVDISGYRLCMRKSEAALINMQESENHIER